MTVRVFKIFGRQVALGDWQIILLACLVAFFVVAALFFFSGVSVRNEISSAPLEKNSEVRLLPGERYVYGTRLDSLYREDEYSVFQGENCVGMHARSLNASADASGNFYELCLDARTGEAKDASVRIGNESLALTEQTQLTSMGVVFFQPWMLALGEGWTWQQNITTTTSALIMNLRRTLVSDYSVEKIEEMKGRRAFKVRIVSRVVEEGTERASAEAIEWIDVDKRVLLYASAEGAEVELVSAPFNVTKKV